MTTQEVRNYLKQYKEADRRVKQLEREYNEELDQIVRTRIARVAGGKIRRKHGNQ